MAGDHLGIVQLAAANILEVTTSVRLAMPSTANP